ncbi:MAG: hypothetical protein KC912_23455 [Proteobacteria bacterium]|nr:hypothetical protein [Pseudomonadota bacterium]
MQDCAGTWGGSAVEDECGTCDDDSTNDCVQDCAGTWGGVAVDTDEDGACDTVDNCPDIANDQTDTDTDNVGDACDACSGAGACLSFESTVTAIPGGGEPSGAAVEDTVTFAVNVPDGANATFDTTGCNGAGCHAVWGFAPVAYEITYSSGYSYVGEIDGVDLMVDRTAPNETNIIFLDGSDRIYQVTDSDNEWHTAGSIPVDLVQATVGVDATDLFELTFFWNEGGGWKSYHYDYTRTGHTVVTRTP